MFTLGYLLDYALLSLGLYLVFRLFQRRRTSGFPLPTGPRGYPLIGNLLDIPTSYEWLTWTRLGEKWGDLISLSVFGHTIIIINSHSLAVEMLNEKNDIYSDRPHIPMVHDVCEMGDAMGCLQNGKRLRAYRKLFQNGLGTSAGIRTFHPQEESLTKLFISKLLESPENLIDHCFRHSGAIILRIAYGYNAQETNDPMIDISTQAMDHFSKASTQGEFLVNQIPLLMKIPDWFPGTGWKRTGREWAKTRRDMEEIPFSFVKEQLVNGQAEDCFVTRWLAKDLSHQEEKELRHAAGSMFGGGSETTAIAIHAFVLMMCIHPSIQNSLQKEIDDTIGQDRLPSFSDRDRLPYLEATLKEVKRFHTIAPNAIPHCTSTDDVQNGMFIPKGAIVLPNVWKMAHDPTVYKDPMAFNPSRFLGDRPEKDPNEYIFGFGRRSGKSRLLADASIYITTAMILFTFDITPRDNFESGDVLVPPVYKNLSGLISRLQPFECSITPRKEIEKLRALLADSDMECEELV
ncbi:cytochrome P450 [Dendrothele bispora CBS 962.96]|uniref:Cytochrome P450 n=1 Tax=Dendrothele bispora (strain CBS 962.96) TaxID=1314807 RepID=A0A4S8KNE8_DENBC|nr:cytochrome P450 [Dendrothele bispora CBS 962.96]